MATPSIFLRIPDGDFSPTSVPYESLSDQTLEQLAEEVGAARTLLEAELERRDALIGKPLPEQLKVYIQKIKKDHQVIKDLQRLEDRHSRLVEIAAGYLAVEPETRTARNYKKLLTDIMKQCNGGIALLCAATLGKHKMANLDVQSRAGLVNYLQSRVGMFSTQVLDSLARQYGFTDKEIPSNEAGPPKKRARMSERGPPASEPETMDSEHPAALQTNRQIQYMFSSIPITYIDLLCDYLPDAVKTSNQWTMERGLDAPTTLCITAMIPKSQNADISVTLCIGQEAGLRMLELFKLRANWSSSQSHL